MNSFCFLIKVIAVYPSSTPILRCEKCHLLFPGETIGTIMIELEMPLANSRFDFRTVQKSINRKITRDRLVGECLNPAQLPLL